MEQHRHRASDLARGQENDMMIELHIINAFTCSSRAMHSLPGSVAQGLPSQH